MVAIIPYVISIDKYILVPIGTYGKVEVDFDKIILQDNAKDGMLTGEVKFILYAYFIHYCCINQN